MQWVTVERMATEAAERQRDEARAIIRGFMGCAELDIDARDKDPETLALETRALRFLNGHASTAFAAIDAPGNGNVWRHKKRGSTYDVIGEAKIQADEPLTDYEVAVVYRCRETGDLWIRRKSEFYDGRFEPAPPAQGRE